MDPGTDLPRETGPAVRSARQQRGLSRRRVSRDAGLRSGELASFERGRRTMTLADLLAVAGSMGTDVDELLPDGVDLDPTPPPDQLRLEDFLSPAETPAAEWATLGPATEVVVERRRIPRATNELTRTFAELQALGGDLVERCARVQQAEPTDDVDALVADLRRVVDALADDPEFMAALACHRQARDEYLRVTTETPAPSWRMRAQSPATG